jgi:quinol monooxygenase YgiN
MPITLINSFIVPPDKEDDFLQTWRSTIDHFATAPGFIQARMHRNTGLNDTTFQYVNIALWEDAEAYHAVLRNFTPAGQRIPGVKACPGLFEIYAEVSPAHQHPEPDK